MRRRGRCRFVSRSRRGNCNLAYVGPHDKPTLRGPGSAAIPWAQRCKRSVLYTTSHSKHVFVPKVDFVSLPGHPKGEPPVPGLSRPVLVVTPLAVMDFTESGDMRLQSLHSGVTLDEVVQNTGFRLVLPSGEPPKTPEPSPEELRLMRQFDLDGLLTIVV